MKKFITIAAMAAFLTVGTASANAATVEELQAQIALLMEQLNGTTSTSTSGSFVYQGGLLKVGSRGQQVMDLQTCLAELGNNPTSNVDGVFGNITKTAVMSFQASKGVAVDGIVGPVTGPLYTAACAGDDMMDDEDEVNVETEFTLGGEGDVTDYDFNAEDDAKADSSKEHIATIEFEVEDGDVALEKVELFFEEGSVNNDLWDNIENIYLEVDGDEIADIDVTDKDDWNEHGDDLNSGKDLYSISLKGDAIFEDGDKVEIEVLVDTTDEVEAGDSDEEYNIWAELRFVNAEGVILYEGEDEDSAADAVAFAIESLDVFDMDISEGDDNPDDDTLDLSSDEDDVTLYVAEFDVDDNQDGILEDGDVVVEITTAATLPVGAVAENVDDLINEVSFYIDGKKIDTDDDNTAVAATTSTTTQVTFSFDLDDYELEADEKYDVEIRADFNSVEDDSVFVGSTVTVTGLSVNGEGADGENFNEADGGVAADDGSFDYDASGDEPEYTVTSGDITVTWTDAVVYSDGNDASSAGDYLAFSFKVKNESGQALTTDNSLSAGTGFELDFNGYAVNEANFLICDDDDQYGIGFGGTCDGTPDTTIADGDSEEYFVVVQYTATSSQDFEIELEKMGGTAIASIWED